MTSWRWEDSTVCSVITTQVTIESVLNSCPEKNRQNSTTQLRETLFLLSFAIGEGEKKKYYRLVGLLEARPGSLQESLSLNSANLAGLNSIGKVMVWFDFFWGEGEVWLAEVTMWSPLLSQHTGDVEGGKIWGGCDQNLVFFISITFHIRFPA